MSQGQSKSNGSNTVVNLLSAVSLVAGAGMAIYGYFKSKEVEQQQAQLHQNQNQNGQNKKKTSLYFTGECCFCLEGFSGKQELCVGNCKHFFHEKCFTEYEAHNSNRSGKLLCPLCRKPL